MKKQIVFLALVLLTATLATAQVAVNTDGTNADPSAILDVKSTDKGMLVPRMTEAQRDAISMPATGLMVYQTDTIPGFYYYNGTNWVSATGVKKLDDLSDARVDTSNIDHSVYIGSGSGSTASGKANLGVGVVTLLQASGDKNTAIGNNAGIIITTGNNNVAVGMDAGNNIKTGSSNIMLGYTVRTSEEYSSNQLNIGDLIYGTNIYGATGRVRIGFTGTYNSSQNHNENNIDTDPPTSTLDIKGSVSYPVTIQVSGNYTILESDYTIITAGTNTVTLPDPTGVRGRVYVIKRVADPLTTSVVSAGTNFVIDGQSTHIITGSYKYIMVQSTGGTWIIISQN